MATLGELCRQHTSLTRDEINHLKQLVSEWGLLADLCFADLLLYVPSTDAEWLIVAQVRPATGQTIYLADYVGVPADNERPLLASAFETGEISEGEIAVDSLPEPARMLAIPVRLGSKRIAVLSREWSNRTGRQPGELERTYLGIFQRFAAMIAEGSFPFHGLVGDSSAAPRVGDGVMVLDDEARVRYASPNAVSALHRVGISANAVGMRLAELGFNDSPVRLAYEDRMPVIEEFDQTPSVTLLTRCMPILAGGEVTGGVLLLRDVTEVRKRDKLLLSKDATIREIHHRVKNNLQTISSLLRLQGRRLESPEAKAAVAESVRRIRTIALVHETLSREPGDDVRVPRDRPAVAPPGRRGSAIARSAGAFHGAGGGRSVAVDHCHSVVGRADRTAAERRRPWLSGGEQRRRRRRAVEPDRRSAQHSRHQRRPRTRFAFRAQQGNRPRPVDRSHAGDHRVGRQHRDAAPGMPEDFEAAGLGEQPKGAGTVVDLTVPI